MSLRARMGLAAGLAVALAVLAVAVSAYAGTRSELLGQVDHSLSGISRQILQPHHGPGSAPGFGTPQQPSFDRGGFGSDCDQGLGINEPGRPPFGGPTGLVELVSPTGSVCLGNNATRKVSPDSGIEAIARSGVGQTYRSMSVNGTHIRVLVTGAGPLGALVIALPLTDIDKTLSNELLLMIVIAAAGIALAAVFGFLVARTAIAPITRFTRQTEEIAENPSRLDSQRLEVSGRDELARLGRTFNSTLDALGRSIESQRNLVADASHELRTPIASIRANLQLLREEERLSDPDRAALREDMIEELDELTALVGDVVELARGAKPSAAYGDVRLDEVVSSLAERARRRSPGLTIEPSVQPAIVRGDSDRIARAVANLLENARKWSPPGGLIEVVQAGGTVSVRDHGPGFHEEDLPFVFDRFHRAKDARSKPGSGLGLAIVRQAAEAQGGAATAANAPGGGAIVSVSFGPAIGVDDGSASAASEVARTTRGSNQSASPSP